jgi:hypothetical protein
VKARGLAVAMGWLAAACAPRAPEPALPYAVAGIHVAQPLESCVVRALGSAESTYYLGPLQEPGALQVQRVRVFTNLVTPTHFLDALVVERRCPDGSAYLELSGSPQGTSYDAEPEILELRLDSILEHVAEICRAKVIAVDRGRLEAEVPETCAR